MAGHDVEEITKTCLDQDRGAPVMSILLAVYEDDLPADCRVSIYSEDWHRVRLAMEQCVQTMQGRLDNSQECPYNPGDN